MCPACMTTLALMAAGAGSAGGLTALVVRRIRARHDTNVSNRKARAEGPDSEEKLR